MFYVITRESLYYANLRQAYLNSPAYATRISSRTVLFMSVPDAYKNEIKLRQVFGDTITRIWITSDCKKLAKLVDERDKLAFKLETAETKLIRRSNKVRQKAMKNGEFASDTCLDCESSNPAWSHKVKRPTHRLRFLFGQKVDSIRWYRQQLVKATKEVEVLQRKHQDGDAKKLSAMFVEFGSQSDAQIALQTLSHHQPFHMTPRFIGVAPRDVVWSALNLSWWQRIIRKFAVQGGLAAMVIFWSFPAALVGTISNITYLSKIIPPLKFILELPDFIKGAIEGLLPSAALVALMSLVPIICRSKYYPTVSTSKCMLTLSQSLCSPRWSAVLGSSRALHPERSFCVPSRTSLLGDNLDFRCVCCYSPDYQGPSFYKGSIGSESAQSHQFLHFLLFASGSEYELYGSCSDCQRSVVQIRDYFLRLFSASSVPTMG